MKYRPHLLAIFAVLVCPYAGAQTTSAPMAAAPRGATASSNAAVFKACAAAPASKEICPLDGTFGLFKLARNNDILDFKVSNSVPRVVNQNYGWRLKLNRKTGKVRVLERMTLPETPNTWGAGGQPYGMSADRKTISLDVTLTIYDGTISKSWDVADGDPPGHYLITAYVGNADPVQFEFDVVNPK